jgi:lipopolysaccharide/colanic/teichoic acid biosynthesis glycosyltransferase
MIKRFFDIIFSIIGLIFLLPIFLIVGVLIKTTSKGTVFYRGVRTGLHGKPFRIYKFRSMVTNAEQIGGTTTADRDPRITKVGVFIRKYKLDELPQLLNVLIGDMSFVGPRPEVTEYTDLFNEEEKKILSVKPGITDFASIEFHDLQSHVGTCNVDEIFKQEILPRKNMLRLKYVREQSLTTDLYILFKTILLIVSKSLIRKTK